MFVKYNDVVESNKAVYFQKSNHYCKINLAKSPILVRGVLVASRPSSMLRISSLSSSSCSFVEKNSGDTVIEEATLALITAFFDNGINETACNFKSQ